MKKILSLVLALCMVCCAAAAFAAGSKTGGDIPAVEGASIIITGDDAFTTQLIESGDVASALPDDVKAEIEGMDSFDEVVTVAVTDFDAEKAEDVAATFTFDTPYGANIPLKLLVHIGDTWYVLDAAADEAGDVTATFPADLLKQIDAAGSATLVVASASANGTAIIITEDNAYTAALKESGDVLAVLPDDVKAAIEDLNNFNEINSIAVVGYDPENTGDVTATFTFDTAYEADAKIALLVYVNDAWNVLDAAANENGEVTATFGADLVAEINDAGTATMVAASDK